MGARGENIIIIKLIYKHVFLPFLTSDVLHLSGIVLVQSSGGFDFTYMYVTPCLLVQVTLLVEIASVVNTVLPMW